MLLPISLEIEEYKLQDKLNILARKNLESAFRKFKKDHIKKVIHIQY